MTTELPRGMVEGSTGFAAGKPWIVTPQDLELPWGGFSDGRRFRCFLCGHRFTEGDVCRFQFNPSGPNAFICSACDGQDVLARMAAHCEEARTRFWWWYENSLRGP